MLSTMCVASIVYLPTSSLTELVRVNYVVSKYVNSYNDYYVF